MLKAEARKRIFRATTLLQAAARREGLLRLSVEDFATEALARIRGTPDRPGRAGRARELQASLAELIAEAEAKTTEEAPKKNPVVA